MAMIHVFAMALRSRYKFRIEIICDYYSEYIKIYNNPPQRNSISVFLTKNNDVLSQFAINRIFVDISDSSCFDAIDEFLSKRFY